MKPELEFAHAMVELGVPVFHARPHQGWCGQCESMREPCHFSKVGFWLPRGWQNTQPDHRLVDRWKPGDALGAVMGVVYDLVDYDTRHDPDGTTFQRLWGRDGTGQRLIPKVYARAGSPSGGRHYFIKSLNVRSMDKLMDGLDIKAGTVNADDFESHGRGYAFIFPTIRLSKKDGQYRTYTARTMPKAPEDEDRSGEELRRTMKEQWQRDHPQADVKGSIIAEWAREHVIGRAIRKMRNTTPGDRDNTLRDKLWLLVNNEATEADYDKLAAAAIETGLDPRLVAQKIQRARMRVTGRLDMTLKKYGTEDARVDTRAGDNDAETWRRVAESEVSEARQRRSTQPVDESEDGPSED